VTAHLTAIVLAVIAAGFSMRGMVVLFLGDQRRPWLWE
jgi:hypothetical protein